MIGGTPHFTQTTFFFLNLVQYAKSMIRKNILPSRSSLSENWIYFYEKMRKLHYWSSEMMKK